MNPKRPLVRRILFWAGFLSVLLLVGVVWAGIHVYRTIETEGAYVDSNGVRLHYIDRGSGSPVILLHGLGTNGPANWMVTGVFADLEREHRVIALDLRGHGRSAKPHAPQQYGIQMVHDIARLMDHLHIEKAHIVGYSLGGFLALKFAAIYPDRTLSVAPCASGWPEDPEKDLAFLKELGGALEGNASLTPLLQRLQPPDEQHSEARLLTVDLALSSVNDLTALGAMLQSADQILLSREELGRITVPLLAIAGDRDPFLEFARELQNALPQTQLVVVHNGDHFNTIAKAEFAEALAEFLNAHPEIEENRADAML